MFCQVIADISHGDVDRIFEYSFDENCGVRKGSRVIVPFGKFTTEGFVIGISETSEYPPEKIKSVIRVLEDTPALTEETLALSEYVKRRCYVTRAAALRLFLPVEMRKGRVKERLVRVAALAGGLNVDEAAADLKKTAVKQRDLLYYLAENGKTETARLSENFGASALNALVKKGVITLAEEKFLRSPYKDLGERKKNVNLTEKQNAAVETVENADKTITLLYGVTGSGKTEVYLELISRAISRGKTAIMLVPEISLTPQMLSQLRARFGSAAAIMHSGLSAGERFDEWWRLRTGEAVIAIGARSAIFAPLENIGIIVIDEEHDGSYVSESSPRYSTIELAKKRAEYWGAKLVLGSATPSVESYLKAEEGEYNLARLPDRINKKPLPDVEIADMRGEVRRGNNTPFSGALKAELEKCLKAGEQAMIFLNQRGYSRSVICTECGHVQQCSSCDVALTYHKEDESLLCHYCGAKYKMITACTECGSPFIRHGGYGTERAVIELKKLFPEARILRMDRDTTATKEGHFKILKEFAERKADILVGTQMIAKGHDFPMVTLVGILDADASLHFSDYRSSERTFQLITQVAGRCGRSEAAGKVVLQTYSPDNAVLRRAINYDYEGFFRHEISVRKATGFPPYTEIVRVMIAGEDETAAIEVAKKIYTDVSVLCKTDRAKFAFLGCMKAPLKKLQGKFRYQILMRISDSDNSVKDFAAACADKYKTNKVNAYIEVNPNNLT